MDYSVPRRRGLPIWLLILSSLGGVIGFAWYQRDFVAASAIGVMAACGLWGYYCGALRLLGAVGGIAVAYQFAPPAAVWLAAQLKGANSSPWLTQNLCLGLAAIAIAALVTSLVNALSRRWSQDHEDFVLANQLLGFGMGAGQGALLMLLVLSGAVSAAPLASERLRQPADSSHEPFPRMLAQQIVDVAQQTERSTLARLIEQYNPFEHVPQLKQMTRTAVAIQDPEVFARMSNHPAVTKLQSKPSVRAAIDELANDPELRELAMSGKTVNSQTALSLLNNPAIAKLLTQPELLRDIAQALSEFDQDELNSLASFPEPQSPPNE